jgi:hypothetical protein
MNTRIDNLIAGASAFTSLRATNAVIGGNGCSWFNVEAKNGIFKLLGTYD